MSQNSIKLIPLIDSKTSIFCHLLEIDGTKIIIDCGIDMNYDFAIYSPIESIIRSSDCILLTSFDLKHMGGIGLFPEIPVYCSIPTAVLGKIVLENFKAQLIYKMEYEINLDDIQSNRKMKKNITEDHESSYSSIIENVSTFNPKQIKFSQPFKIKNIEINCYNAGNILGNSAFKIVKDQQSVVICYNFNHKRENILDGLDLNSIINSDIFITNSQYVKEKECLIRTRNENIVSEILFNPTNLENSETNTNSENLPSKTIITISFSRILELISILYDQEIIIVSNFAKVFFERAKSMIEWASPRAHDFLFNSKVHFGTISEVSSYNIIVIVDEINNFGCLGTILNLFNSPENKLLLFDRQVNDFNLECLNVYEYSYTKKAKIAPSSKIILEDMDSEDDNLDIWTKAKNTIFLNSLSYKNMKFPRIKKRRHNNSYGESVNFTFEKNIENKDNLNDSPIANEEVIENKILKSVGISPKFTIKSIDMPGISDFTSCKNIIQSMEAKQIVLVEDFDDLSRFIYSVFCLENINENIFICQSELILGTLKAIPKFKVSESIMELQFKNIGDKKVAKCRAIIKDEIVDLVGDYDNFTIGLYDKTHIKKMLIEHGFHVIEDEHCLLINNGLKLFFNPNNKIFVEFESTDLLIRVRDILYKFLAIV